MANETEVTLTDAQQRAVARIKRKHMEYRAYGDQAKYEFKQFELRQGYKSVFVTSEIGLKDDEGTLAAVYCRDYRHFSIGTRGGIKLLNGINHSAHGDAVFYTKVR